MADSTYKPKVTTAPSADPVLSKTTQDYMKLIEQMNEARVKKLQVIAKRNRITASAIGAGVLGIYLYSIFAVKQETFLDDFNEPAKTLKE